MVGEGAGAAQILPGNDLRRRALILCAVVIDLRGVEQHHAQGLLDQLVVYTLQGSFDGGVKAPEPEETEPAGETGARRADEDLS